MFTKTLRLSSILCALTLVGAVTLPDVSLAAETQAQTPKPSTWVRIKHRGHRLNKPGRFLRNNGSRLLRKFGLGEIIKPSEHKTKSKTLAEYETWLNGKAGHKGQIHESVREGNESRDRMDRNFHEQRQVEDGALHDVRAQADGINKHAAKVLKKHATEGGVWKDTTGEYHLKTKHRAVSLAKGVVPGALLGSAAAAVTGVAQAGGWAAFAMHGITGGIWMAALSTPLSVGIGAVLGLAVLAKIYTGSNKSRLEAHKPGADAKAGSEFVQDLIKQAQVQKRSASELADALKVGQADPARVEVAPEVQDALRQRNEESGKYRGAVEKMIAANQTEMNALTDRMQAVLDGLQNETAAARTSMKKDQEAFAQQNEAHLKAQQNSPTARMLADLDARAKKLGGNFGKAANLFAEEAVRGTPFAGGPTTTPPPPPPPGD